MPRLSENAFDYYLGLGNARSYQAVANHFGVCKQTVTNHAKKQRWQQRIAEATQAARNEAEAAFKRDEVDRKRHHLKVSRELIAKAADVLRVLPMTAMESVQTIDMAMRCERLLLGEPTDRTENTLEEILREDVRQWMQRATDDASDGRDVEESESVVDADRE